MDTSHQPGDRIDYQRLALRGQALRAQALLVAGKAIGGYITRHLIAPLQRWRENNARYQELMALDNRTLKDIGISRSDIPALASGQWTRPSENAQSAAGPRLTCVVDNGAQGGIHKSSEARLPPRAA